MKSTALDFVGLRGILWHDDWFKTFQVNCDKKLHIPNFPSPEAYEAFDNEGIELWKEIRKELAPYYNVFYYSTRLEGVFKQPDAPMVKRIRLMRDWFCPITWFVDDVGCFNPAELPASQETIDRLNNLQEVADATFDSHYPPNSTFPSEEAARLWSREFTRLWVQLQRELSTAYEVYVRDHPPGGVHLLSLDEWMEIYKGRYLQEDIDNADQSLLLCK